MQEPAMPRREDQFPNSVNATPRKGSPDPHSIPSANQGGADSAEDPAEKRALDEDEQTMRKDIASDPRSRDVDPDD
jgi:hypothetical protein